MPDLRLYLLGSPCIECSGEPVVIKLRKAVALLVYLALTERGHSRDALATLFWPEMDQNRARAGLRYALAALKKALDADWAEDQYPLDVSRETVSLNPQADIWLDVGEFQDLLVECQTHGHAGDQVCPNCLPLLSEAAGLYRDDFLAGFTLRDCPAFDEWQFFQTEGLRADLAGVLERLVWGHSAQGKFEEAIPHARRWLGVDPLHEPAHRHLMQLYAWSGQRAAALRQYDECVRILQAELGLPPEEQTRDLHRAIREKCELSPAGERFVSTSRVDVLNNRYRLEAELGRGGMGIVYRAHDLLLDREVAVKAWSAATLGSEGRARLLDEAQAVAKLSHPNIIRVYDAGEADGLPFIVMEQAEGKSLFEHKPASCDEILSIARQICAALQHAHEQGIVHRDLKPENVIITSGPSTEGGGTVKLTDFGLARPVASRITSEGTIAGTVFYLAPEVALGRSFDARADLYALGVMLYEWTTGCLPFTADDPLAFISQHLHASVIPPRTRNPEIPLALDALIVRLLSKDPRDRPGSAADVLQLLNAEDLLARQAPALPETSVSRQIGSGRLVGREYELQIARSLWSQVLSGQGQLLLISGEPGVGKTRLVRELVTQARVTGGRALVGASYAEGGVPYAPIVQILRRSLDDVVNELEMPEFLLAALLALVPSLRLRYPHLEPEPELDDPRAERQRLFDNLVTYLTAWSERTPLLLVLEDVHWADSGTFALLRHVARHSRHARLMMIVTFRPVGLEEAQPLHEMLLDLNRERLEAHLRLRRLDREQTGEMLVALLGGEITPDLLDDIYGETEGNPFFVEEVCRALVESGKLYLQDGHWHRPGIAELGIPQSVRVAIVSRVSALPAESQKTLQLAAVLGRAFDFETIAEASARLEATEDEDALMDALEYAERAQLIEKLGEEGGGAFSFVHALIPTTLVESMRSMQRRRLHRCAAAVIQTRRPDDFEALARHYHQAGQASKAADYLLQAGDRARRLYAHQEAIRNYRQALESLRKRAGRSGESGRELERAARTLMKLGLTYHNAFNFQEARQAYQEGFALWQRMADVELAASPPPSPHPLRMTTLEPGSLSPGVAMNHPSAVLQDQLFSGLVEVSPDMSVVPDVARSWEVLDGGRRYVFHLRDDVLWSDGVPVTAADFAYAWKRALDPARRWRAAIQLYDIQGARAYHEAEVADPDRVGVCALDALTLAVTLEGPANYFPYLLAFSPMLPVPRHVVPLYGEAWTELDHIVTNGPFRLVALERGKSLTLERNPTYHGRLTGNVQRVECSFLSGQPSQFLQMYDEDRLDICGDLAPAEMNRARQRYAGEYVSGPRLSIDFIGFDVSRPPFDDRRVRQAFALATDREMLADVTLKGYAFPATGGLVPPGMPGHSAGIGPPYNPERARRLLAEAGYPYGRGFPALDCLARDDPGHDLLCGYLQAQWLENLGVETRWQEIEWGRFPDRMSEAMPHLWVVGWWADYPDPDDYLRLMWWLPPGWQNQAYDRLVAGARRAMDQEVRMSMYQEADRILVEEAPLLPLCYARLHLLIKPWVRRFPTSPLKWWYWKDVILEPH
jgi:oligopeptide transport system substrate-binding protein